ncbi:unnamed protein product [Caretta caretta]
MRRLRARPGVRINVSGCRCSGLPQLGGSAVFAVRRPSLPRRRAEGRRQDCHRRVETDTRCGRSGRCLRGARLSDGGGPGTFLPGRLFPGGRECARTLPSRGHGVHGSPGFKKGSRSSRRRMIQNVCTDRKEQIHCSAITEYWHLPAMCFQILLCGVRGILQAPIQGFA